MALPQKAGKCRPFLLLGFSLRERSPASPRKERPGFLKIYFVLQRPRLPAGGENPLKRPPLQTQAVTFLAAHVNALYQAKAQIHTDSRRAPRAEEGESYAHSRQHGQAHANVGNGLQRNDAKIAKADIFAQVIPRGVGHVERFQHKQKKQQQNQRAAYKPQFLSRHREDIREQSRPPPGCRGTAPDQ